MKSIVKKIAIGLGALLLTTQADTLLAQQAPTAQDTLNDRISALEQQVFQQKRGEDHFMVVGLTTFGLVTNKTVTTIGGVSTTSRTNTFGDADRYEFSPMFLWRHDNKFLMEFEPSFNNDGLGVNWADISYFAAPGLIIRGGYMVLPFGIYNKRLAAGWIDKLATDPIGLDYPASTDYGFEIMGGLPLGDMKWSYDVGIFNGMQLLPDGELQSAGLTDNNTNKTISGRIAILPLSNSALELGFSALAGKVGDAGSAYSNASTNMYAFDLNYIQPIKPFSVNIKAQYNIVNIDRQNYINPNDSTQTYSYNNHSTSGFAQISVRPAFLDNGLKNFELTYRYANSTSPAMSAWGAKADQSTIGIAYWINWRTVLKITHEMVNTNSTVNTAIFPDGGISKSDSWFIQFSIQL
ncbi:hypothetical protein [Mucilaginibacter sp.]|uniref:hypothetical protein n=1 Tax=Mucilaginibacter sp. TaxID=1882438 RepID=UPI00283DC5F4|nr:hypothetical protein [Mucilaginibacter sp.]MDR3693982.1 hypothetical protein [Mucilaginibacter sp.]